MFSSVFKTGIRSIYNVSETATFYSDFWSIYPAKHKRSGKMVSVFIFDKTDFEKSVTHLCSQTPNTKNPKHIISECYELIQFGIMQLAKLKHPHILTVVEVLELTRLKFIFVSEPLVGSLQTIGFDSANPLEIKKGVLEISKALQFLHNSCDMVHLNLQPSSVLVSAYGDWKLSAFYFIKSLLEMSSSEQENFCIMNTSSFVPFANINLNFVAPEIVLDSGGARLGAPNDIWSLGHLIIYLFNRESVLALEAVNLSEYKHAIQLFEKKFCNHKVSELGYLFKSVPHQLQSTIMNLLRRYPHDRFTIDQFIESDFFQDNLMKVMCFVDEYSSKSSNEKMVFLDGILTDANLLPALPSSFKINKFLPLMVDNVLKEISFIPTSAAEDSHGVLIAKTLKIVFHLAQGLSKLSFQDRVFETLATDGKAKKNSQNLIRSLINSSVHVRLVFVQSLTLLMEKLNPKEVTQVIKMLCPLCLKNTPTTDQSLTHQIELQDLFLKNVLQFINIIDFPYIKSDLIPLVCHVFKTTTILSTKLQAIATFKMLLNDKILDEDTIVDSIFPVFLNLKSRDKRVVSSVIDYFAGLAESDVIKNVPLLIESGLSKCLQLAFGCEGISSTEFLAFVKTVRQLEDNLIRRRVNQLNSSTNPADLTPTDNFDVLIKGVSLDSSRNFSRSLPLKESMRPTHDMTKPLAELETAVHPSSEPMITESSSMQMNSKKFLSLTPAIPTPRDGVSILRKIDLAENVSFDVGKKNLNPKQGRSKSDISGNAKLPPGYSSSLLTPHIPTGSDG